jgi:hypothetical protein
LHAEKYLPSRGVRARPNQGRLRTKFHNETRIVRDDTPA